MRPTVFRLTLLLVLVVWKNSKVAMASEPQRNAPGARTEVHRICKALCLESGVEQKLTMVFVLYVDRKFSRYLDYLWKLPRALVYLSKKDIVLGDRQTEIVISWERELHSRGESRLKYWNLPGSCGHRLGACMNRDTFYLTFHRVQKRVLVQIRDWAESDARKIH